MTYPPGSLPVHYEPATTHSTCLVASVAMAANYLVGERQFTETQIRQELQKQNLDETSIAAVQSYLDSKGLHLLTLSGEMNGKPPTSLRYWLQTRGYPVICIINRQGINPAFNHAIVLIGITKPADGSADMFHYLDPSGPEPAYSCTASDFEVLWTRGQNAMMIVVAPPPDSQPARVPEIPASSAGE